ncbi:hypothetical protein GGQ22_07020 [Nocardioides sp. zg-579]|uniref:Peptidase MA-like domain-containing protein n=1 Tax=Nocardioides marmotae TaxID=2663857 RepID=A0A6I3J613_9ACTN|nr:hypothetical protein [Nocardioides marmotae]MCR6031193.1 hypothetical protein [Gordonia jinghuaiqii]MTB94832.1 hypothetical protein [Nocardioides marmotae]QKE01182.1 hypothetical protein HPC71_08955 [Nocardioides marmotae]
MPTTPSERSLRPHRPRSPRRSRRLAAQVACWALLAGALPACSLVGGDEDPATSAEAAGPPAAADVVAGLRRALERRADAVRRGDRRAFAAGLARRTPQVREQQLTWFDNLAQLPLAELGYAFDRQNIVRRGDAYWVVVEQSMQLAGYDDQPVVSHDRFLFRPAPRNERRMLLASVTDDAWEDEHDVRPQPWDLGPVQVRGGLGVLGVFDAGSVGSAAGVIASVERGIADVSAALPEPWRRTVVVYALSSTEFLQTIEELPGGDPERLDGVAFPVAAGPGQAGAAATRFALHPRMLARSGPQRDRLVRHELVHVALGERDDEAPVWLSEGIAEYVSVRPVDPADRVVAEAALGRAVEGVDGLPVGESFTAAGDAPVASYGLSWWVCEYVAGSFGEEALWALLDAFGSPGADEDEVLTRVLGLTADQLADRAARLMVATFVPGAGPGSGPEVGDQDPGAPSGVSSPSPSAPARPSSSALRRRSAS